MSARLVVVDLGVGDAGVIVDDGVNERVSDQRIPVVPLRRIGSVAARFLLPCGRPTNRQPPPSGMLPSFFTSTWISEPGCVVFVTAGRFPGLHIDVRESVEVAAHQDCVNGRRRHPEPAGDLNRARAAS